MQSIADQLPPEIAHQIHPDWRKNEAEYWAVRDQLLAQFQDQWIAYAGGQVLISGKSSVEVFHAAQLSGRHPFVTCVGKETGATRIRRVSFLYDTSYRSQALPSISVEFRRSPGSPGILLDAVIPDTGADVSVLPWSDCQSLQLDAAQGIPNYFTGLSGSATGTIVFTVVAQVDGQEYLCELHADFAGQERILGRDVLNCIDVLFRGPAAEVVINP